MDSSGIGELVAGFTYCANQNGSLVLNRLSKSIHELLQLTKLYRIFQPSSVDYTEFPSLDLSAANLRPLQKAIDLSHNPLPSMGLLLAVDHGQIQLLPAVSEGIYRVTTDPGQRIIIATPHTVANLTRCYLREEIEEFEELINSPSCREGDIQRFLERHPKFLLAQQYEKVYPQVILSSGEDLLIPDFLLQPLNRDLCDIVDLKLPTERLIVGPDNHRRLSSAVSRGVAQLRSYRDFFEDKDRRELIRQTYGLTAYRPRLSLVIGRSVSTH